MLDLVIYIGIAAFVAAFIYIIASYAKGLKGSPRELYLMFFTKVTEYSAYGGINIAFILYLSKDMGLSDVSAGTYMGTWSIFLTLLVIIVGPVCDAIGIRKTLLIGSFMLVFSRFLMPFMPNIFLSTFFGFIPMAVGIAITGPVLSVAIKRFTTKETAALGFGLFYTLMNVGFAIGAYIFDLVRHKFGEHAYFSIPLTGLSVSSYQLIILIGFFITIPGMLSILFMRDGVEMTEDNGIVITPGKKIGDGGAFFPALLSTVKHTAVDTFTKMKQVFSEKPFWIFIFMLFITVFVRLTFQHFHYTFPKYGIRIFGDGVKVGSIYGVLNPTMIVILVPLIAALTKKIGSYKMMLIGTFISAFSVFIAVIPHQYFAFLNNTWVGELIFARWLDVPVEGRSPLFFSVILFVIIFTIGEAFWSPRLMQFTAEIAPKGREASYLSLAVLPFFFAKFFVGPLSGWLVKTYTPEGLPSGVENYPDHYMVWVWVGTTAIISPIGLVVFRKLFTRAEKNITDAKAAC